MCTLTFIPKSETEFILTSSRDEDPSRETLVPKKYSINQTAILFPKDALAGGTWLGVSEKKHLVCLLNGAYKAHKRKASYRKSRGLVVLDFLANTFTRSFYENYNFEGIEPFTMIVVSWESTLNLVEIVWDGTKKVWSQKPLQPIIWSSSLLYTDAVKEKRKMWFSEFLKNHKNELPEDLLQFHKTAGEGNPETNLVMDRGFVRTTSISQLIHSNEEFSFQYNDLKTDRKTNSKF